VIVDDFIQAPAVVVGGGIAGLATALSLEDCVLVSNGSIGEGSSRLAQGGIAAAIGRDDTPALHAADTIRVGAQLCDPDIVAVVTDAAASRITWLRDLGTAFDLGADGTPLLGREAGHSRHRIIHAGGDRTGAAVMRALRAATVQRPDIRRLEGFELVDLITAAIVPDAGDVVVFGQGTRDIADRDAWLATLDRFGMLTERAVLLEQLSVRQNLALPFSLALDDLSSNVRDRVASLAAELGLAERLDEPVSALPALLRLRVRLGRALALDPRVLLAEHPNATLDDREQAEFARDLSRIARARGAACLVLTANRRFAQAAADDVFELQPGTGVLKPSSGWRRWFS